MVNENDLCYLGGYPAEGLKQVFGIWNEEIDTLYPGEKVKIISDEEHYEGVEYIFVQNYSEYAVKDIDLGNEYLDIESGEVLNKVSLDAFDVKCLKR